MPLYKDTFFFLCGLWNIKLQVLGPFLHALLSVLTHGIFSLTMGLLGSKTTINEGGLLSVEDDQLIHTLCVGQDPCLLFLSHHARGSSKGDPATQKKNRQFNWFTELDPPGGGELSPDSPILQGA